MNTLRSDAVAFEHGDAYRFEVERKQRTPHRVDYKCFAIEREPPSDEWPLIAEAIQNLRSALDHVVFASVKRGGGSTQFPITDDCCEFKVNGTKRIRRVPQAVRATIEWAQPYHMPHPKRHPLAMLRDLSNFDKHRTLAVVASAIDLEHVGCREDIHIDWKMFATERPLNHGKTHISSFTATSEAEIGEMDVTPGFRYKVRIQGRSLDILVMIAKRVFEVVTARLLRCHGTYLLCPCPGALTTSPGRSLTPSQ